MFEKFIEYLTKFDAFLNGIVWGWPMIILILGTGLLLTIMTKVLQLRKFGDSLNSTIVPTIKSIGKKGGKGKKGVSQFEAFSAAISGTVGTGNIIGVTSAIMTGGPGAVFWMWLSAFFGMVTNYSENVLGLYYRKRDENGEFSGGSFYYIANGVGWKWLGYISAIFCTLAAIGMSGVQTNKITSTITNAVSNDTMAFKIALGLIVAILTAFIIIGGIKRIGRVASMLVPVMSLLFVVLSLIIIGVNYSRIPAAFGLIFGSIGSFKAAVGGFGGYVFAQIIKKGMARGVFSNEAGLGSSVIAHSASETREPVKQGLWGIFEVFFDTFIICTLTALVILTNFTPDYLYKAETLEAGDTATAMLAFSQHFGAFGQICFCVILPLFAFTTILAWSYYGEKAVDFLFGWTKGNGRKTAVLIFKIIYVVLIVGSAVITSGLVWSISDTCNGLMALPNLVALIILSPKLAKITSNYYARKKGAKIEPMLSAYPEQNEQFKVDIQNGID